MCLLVGCRDQAVGTPWPDGGVAPDAEGLLDALPPDATDADADAASCGGGLQGGAPWPAFQRCSTRVGRSPFTSAQTDHLSWRYATTGVVVGSPAVARDGTIYVGGHLGLLQAINPDGSPKWSVDVGPYMLDTPLIGADGTVYVRTQGGSLHAVNPDGQLVWARSYDWVSESSPVIGPTGSIYFATRFDLGDGQVTGGLTSVSSSGDENWSLDFADTLSHTPAVDSQGVVYLGLSSEDWSQGELLAVRPDGDLEWTFPTTYGAGCPSVGVDGSIYIGTGNPYASELGGILYVVSPDGTEQHLTFMDVVLLKCPTQGLDGVLLFTSGNQTIAVTPDGTTKWIFETGEWSTYPIVGADGTVYFGSDDHSVYALGPDGTLQWSYATGAEVAYPAIGAEGVLLVPSYDGYLYAFGP